MLDARAICRYPRDMLSELRERATGEPPESLMMMATPQIVISGEERTGLGLQAIDELGRLDKRLGDDWSLSFEGDELSNKFGERFDLGRALGGEWDSRLPLAAATESLDFELAEPLSGPMPLYSRRKQDLKAIHEDFDGFFKLERKRVIIEVPLEDPPEAPRKEGGE